MFIAVLCKTRPTTTPQLIPCFHDFDARKVSHLLRPDPRFPCVFLAELFHHRCSTCQHHDLYSWPELRVGSERGRGRARGWWQEAPDHCLVLWKMRRMSGTDRCRDHSSLLRTMSLIYAESCEILFPLSIVVLWSRLVIEGAHHQHCQLHVCPDKFKQTAGFYYALSVD